MKIDRHTIIIIMVITMIYNNDSTIKKIYMHKKRSRV